MNRDYEIEIDESTSALLGAIAKANDDPLLLAALAEIDPHEFRQFMNECGAPEDSEALQLLKAAECLDRFKNQVTAQPHSMSSVSNSSDQRNYSEGYSQRLTYLLIGGGIGAIVALLLTPKSGKEVRGDIAAATHRGISRSREAAQELGNQARDYYEATRNLAADRYAGAAEKGKDVAQTARDSASGQAGTIAAAIDAGKKAYQEEKRKTELTGSLEAARKYNKET